MSSEVTILLNFINMAVLASTPLLLATLGEILTEKSGNLNLGVEGMMFMGAIASLASAYHYEQAVSLAGGIPSPLIAAGIATLAAAAAGGVRRRGSRVRPWAPRCRRLGLCRSRRAPRTPSSRVFRPPAGPRW